MSEGKNNNMQSDPSPQTQTQSPDWGKWLAENGRKLYLFANQQTRSEDDAKDILQDALVKLAQKVSNGTFQGDENNWLPYLYTAIRHLAIDLGRREDRRKRREEKSYEDEIEPTNVPTNWFVPDDGSETQALLEQELKKLPQKFAEVITLKIWGEQTFQQIADALDLSINTVASRYRYGIDLLRKSLQNNSDHNFPS